MKKKRQLYSYSSIIFLTIGLIGGAFWYLKTKSSDRPIPPSLPTVASTNSSQNVTTFMIGGDMMFDRYIAYKFRDDLKQSVANLGEDFFKSADISIVNLEGPISNKPTEIDINPENLVFNFPPETTEVLKSLNLKAVSLANNHTLNAGQSGLENTKRTLSEAGIITIGEPSKISENSIYRFSFGEQKVSLMAVNAFNRRPDLEEVIGQEENANAYIIVYPHWGNEYQTAHSLAQERLAHQWINQGVDLIVGSHPHVIQDAEIYLGKPIFYSLGNLLFDQSFSKETQQGLVIVGKITNESLELTLLPIKIKNYQPELMQGKEKEIIVNRLKEDLGQDVSSSSDGYDTIKIAR